MSLNNNSKFRHRKCERKTWKNKERQTKEEIEIKDTKYQEQENTPSQVLTLTTISHESSTFFLRYLNAMLIFFNRKFIKCFTKIILQFPKFNNTVPILFDMT